MKRSLFSLFMVAVLALGWHVVVNVGIVWSSEEIKSKGEFSDITPEYEWARIAIDFVSERGIIIGTSNNKFSPSAIVTKEQLAKILVCAFNLEPANREIQLYPDVPGTLWSATYIADADKYIYTSGSLFNPAQNITREDAAYALVRAQGQEGAILVNDALDIFTDNGEINPDIRQEVIIAFLKGYIQGDGYNINPTREVSRAEMAVMLYRAQGQEAEEDLMPIEGESEVDVETAKEWAISRGAAEIFVNIADTYWEYAAQTGIRADVMYAQSAKETAFGNYTGNVRADMNNWAGIKTKDATGDLPEDHETFATPQDGVRAHYNHMCAYVGLNPVGDTHDRYNIVLTTTWAGTIKTVDQLGGRWAPDENYGNSIISDYLDDMMKK